MFETTKLPQNIWHHSPIHAVPHPTRMETSIALLQMTVHFTTLINQIKILGGGGEREINKQTNKQTNQMLLWRSLTNFKKCYATVPF